MAIRISNSSLVVLLLLMSLLSACNGQSKTIENSPTRDPVNDILAVEPEFHIAHYIRHIHQDKNDNFWFGTNGFGVVHYNGDSLQYFSNEQGFNGEQITGIAEDSERNLWFAGNQGLVKYEWRKPDEGKFVFSNITNGLLEGGKVRSLFVDSRDIVWLGTVNGPIRYDGHKFEAFNLPYSEGAGDSFFSNLTTWCIYEDCKGNMWFGTNGNGVFKYDGKSFVQYTEEDGLTDSNVDVIIQDKHGNMWFGTRFGGVSQYDGSTFTNYTMYDGNSIGYDEVVEIYEDSTGHIWMSSEGYGVYKYDGKAFINYFKDQGLQVKAVQTIYEDRQGRLWVGGGGGLYRFDGTGFIQVKEKGPW